MLRRFAIAFLSISLFASEISKEQRAKELAEKAAATMWTRSDGAAFHETVKFAIYSPGKPDIQGVYRRDQLDSKHYRERLAAGEIDDIFVVNGDKSWHKDPKPVLFGAIFYVHTYVPPVSLGQPDWKVARVFEVEGKPGVECVEYKEYAETQCFDSDGLLLREETPTFRMAYEQYKTLGAKKFPSLYKLELDDGTRAVAEVEMTAGDDLRADLFNPPAAANLVAGPSPCTPVTAPKVELAPDPAWPDRGENGKVTLAVVVGKDGKVHDARVVGSLTPQNDREALRAIRAWTFKPANCAGQPIDVNINVEINFKKY